jgi:hypothetical protein
MMRPDKKGWVVNKESGMDDGEVGGGTKGNK